MARMMAARACGAGDGILSGSGGGRPTMLYRLFGVDGSLLYVGITINIRNRMYGHACSSPWWNEVGHGEAVWYARHAEAEYHEHKVISSRWPRYNKNLWFDYTAWADWQYPIYS
jgi:hypothetical protein